MKPTIMDRYVEKTAPTLSEIFQSSSGDSSSLFVTILTVEDVEMLHDTFCTPFLPLLLQLQAQEGGGGGISSSNRWNNPPTSPTTVPLLNLPPPSAASLPPSAIRDTMNGGRGSLTTPGSARSKRITFQSENSSDSPPLGPAAHSSSSSSLHQQYPPNKSSVRLNASSAFRPRAEQFCLPFDEFVSAVCEVTFLRLMAIRSGVLNSGSSSSGGKGGGGGGGGVAPSAGSTTGTSSSSAAAATAHNHPGRGTSSAPLLSNLMPFHEVVLDAAGPSRTSSASRMTVESSSASTSAGFRDTRFEQIQELLKQCTEKDLRFDVRRVAMMWASTLARPLYQSASMVSGSVIPPAAIVSRVKQYQMERHQQALQQQQQQRKSGGAAPSPFSSGVDDDSYQSNAVPFANDDQELELVVWWSNVTASFIRDVAQRDAVEELNMDIRPTTKDVTRCAARNMHGVSPTIAILASGRGGQKIITGGADGLVKRWSAVTGAFDATLYNSGAAWIVGLALVRQEHHLVVAASNNRLAVLDLVTGSTLQTYLGCVSLASAVKEVDTRSVFHTQRYGMTPGESGARQVHFENVHELTQHEFRELRRVAQGSPMSRNVSVKPITGFVSPTCFSYVEALQVCIFGTVTGTVGIFDISEDIRQTSRITGSTISSLSLLHSCRPHLDAVTALCYSRKLSILITSGLDGCIYKISYDTGSTVGGAPSAPPSSSSHGAAPTMTGKWSSPLRHNVSELAPRPIVGMSWSEEGFLLATFTSDRVIRLWSLMRAEPIHMLDAAQSDVLSCAFLFTPTVRVTRPIGSPVRGGGADSPPTASTSPPTSPRAAGNEEHSQKFAVLLADKSIQLFDLKTFKHLQTLSQSVTTEGGGGGGGSGGAALESLRHTVNKSIGDASGTLVYDMQRGMFACCLRAPVLYVNPAALPPSPPTSALQSPQRNRALFDPQPSSPQMDLTAVDAAAYKKEVLAARKEVLMISTAPYVPANPELLVAPARGGGAGQAIRNTPKVIVTSGDEANLCQWELQTGASLRTDTVARQLRRFRAANGLSDGIGLSNKNTDPTTEEVDEVQLTSCGWIDNSVPVVGAEPHHQHHPGSASGNTRLVTGTQAGSLVVWDGPTYTLLKVLPVTPGTGEKPLNGASPHTDVSCVATLGSHAVCCMGNVIVLYSEQYQDDVRHDATASITPRTNSHANMSKATTASASSSPVASRAPSLVLPSLSAVTACVFVRDTLLAVSTTDTIVYFVSLVTGSSVASIGSSKRSLTELKLVGSVNVSSSISDNDTATQGEFQVEPATIVSLLLLNRYKQSVLIVLFDDGRVVLVSVGQDRGALLHRVRLMHPLDSGVQAAALTTTSDSHLAVGDASGRVRVYDVTGVTVASQQRAAQGSAAAAAAGKEGGALTTTASSMHLRSVTSMRGATNNSNNASSLVASPRGGGGGATPSTYMSTNVLIPAITATNTWRRAIVQTHLFQGTTDAVTALAFTGDKSDSFLIVGSSTGDLRCFKFFPDDEVLHVGTFGIHRWDIDRPETFLHEVLPQPPSHRPRSHQGGTAAEGDALSLSTANSHHHPHHPHSGEPHVMDAAGEAYLDQIIVSGQKKLRNALQTTLAAIQLQKTTGDSQAAAAAVGLASPSLQLSGMYTSGSSGAQQPSLGLDSSRALTRDASLLHHNSTVGDMTLTSTGVKRPHRPDTLQLTQTVNSSSSRGGPPFALDQTAAGLQDNTLPSNWSLTTASRPGTRGTAPAVPQPPLWTPPSTANGVRPGTLGSRGGGGGGAATGRLGPHANNIPAPPPGTAPLSASARPLTSSGAPFPLPRYPVWNPPPTPAQAVGALLPTVADTSSLPLLVAAATHLTNTTSTMMAPQDLFASAVVGPYPQQSINTNSGPIGGSGGTVVMPKVLQVRRRQIDAPEIDYGGALNHFGNSSHRGSTSDLWAASNSEGSAGKSPSPRRRSSLLKVEGGTTPRTLLPRGSADARARIVGIGGAHDESCESEDDDEEDPNAHASQLYSLLSNAVKKCEAPSGEGLQPDRDDEVKQKLSGGEDAASGGTREISSSVFLTDVAAITSGGGGPNSGRQTTLLPPTLSMGDLSIANQNTSRANTANNNKDKSSNFRAAASFIGRVARNVTIHSQKAAIQMVEPLWPHRGILGQHAPFAVDFDTDQQQQAGDAGGTVALHHETENDPRAASFASSTTRGSPRKSRMSGSSNTTIQMMHPDSSSSLHGAEQHKEEQARLYTRILLEGMAKRLDRVQPQGSPRSGFAKRVARLYETDAQKRERRGRAMARSQAEKAESALSPAGKRLTNGKHSLTSPGTAGSSTAICLYNGGRGDHDDMLLIDPEDPTEHERDPTTALLASQEAEDDDEEDDDDDDDDEDILQTLRSPETAKTFAMLEERLRQHKKNRELGGANLGAVVTTAVSGGGSTGSGEGGQGPPVSSWIGRVSSRLVTDPIVLTIPSTVREDQRAAAMEWQQLQSRSAQHKRLPSTSPGGRFASSSPRR